jgi:hypothetical protein
MPYSTAWYCNRPKRSWVRVSSIVLMMTYFCGLVRRHNHTKADSFRDFPAYNGGTMQGLWATSASSLRDILTEVRGSHPDPFLSAHCHSRYKAPGPSWPGALTRLSGIEAALLQDLTWWGPVMEDRLHRWSDEQNPASQDSCMAER